MSNLKKFKFLNFIILPSSTYAIQNPLANLPPSTTESSLNPKQTPNLQIPNLKPTYTTLLPTYTYSPPSSRPHTRPAFSWPQNRSATHTQTGHLLLMSRENMCAHYCCCIPYHPTISAHVGERLQFAVQILATEVVVRPFRVPPPSCCSPCEYALYRLSITRSAGCLLFAYRHTPYFVTIFFLMTINCFFSKIFKEILF